MGQLSGGHVPHSSRQVLCHPALRTDLPTPLPTPLPPKRLARLSQAHPNPPWSSRVCVHQISGWRAAVRRVRPALALTSTHTTSITSSTSTLQAKPRCCHCCYCCHCCHCCFSAYPPANTCAVREYVIAFSDNPPPRGPHLGAQKVDATAANQGFQKASDKTTGRFRPS